MRLRNLLVLLGSMIAVGLAVILLLRERKRSALRADAELTFSRLATCLVGADAHGKRFKDTILDAEERESIDPRGSDWPKRCRQYTDPALRAHALALGAGVVDHDGSLTAISDALDLGLTPPPEPLDALITLWTQIPSEVPQPRPRPAGAKLSSLTPLHAVMATASLGDVDVQATTVHFTLIANNDRDPPRVACDFDPKLDGAVCEIPPSVPVVDVLGRGRGVAPLYVKLDAESSSVVVDAKATEIVRLPNYGYGYAFADGRIAVLSNGGLGNDDRLLFVREASGTVSSRSMAGIANRFRAAGSWILWKETDPDHRSEPAKVRAFDLASAGAPLDLGPVERREGGGTSSGVCRSESHIFVDLSPALAIHDPEKGWSLVEETPRDGARSMSCSGATVKIVDATNRGVTLQTCTADKCEKKDAAIAVDPHEFRASAIGDDILLFWTQGRSVYTMRAPIEKLPDAPIEEVVRADEPIDFAHRDAGTSFTSLPPAPSLVATPDGIVLFLMSHDAPKLFAIAVPIDGAPHPLVSH